MNIELFASWFCETGVCRNLIVAGLIMASIGIVLIARGLNGIAKVRQGKKKKESFNKDAFQVIMGILLFVFAVAISVPIWGSVVFEDSY